MPLIRTQQCGSGQATIAGCSVAKAILAIAPKTPLAFIITTV